MITKLESFETSLQQIESIMGKEKFKARLGTIHNFGFPGALLFFGYFVSIPVTNGSTFVLNP